MKTYLTENANNTLEYISQYKDYHDSTANRNKIWLPVKSLIANSSRLKRKLLTTDGVVQFKIGWTISHTSLTACTKTRNTGTPTNKVSFVFELVLELMVSGQRLVVSVFGGYGQLLIQEGVPVFRRSSGVPGFSTCRLSRNFYSKNLFFVKDIARAPILEELTKLKDLPSLV